VIKGKAYPTLVARITDPDIIFNIAEVGWETTELVTTLNIPDIFIWNFIEFITVIYNIA
jgi:hypothetical protein